MKKQHSIDISGTRFAELLASRRRFLGLSKIDLAEKASVSGKVVHQIEGRSRDRFLEKTLLLLAEAIETPLEDLLRPRDPQTAGPAQERPQRTGSPSEEIEPLVAASSKAVRGRRGRWIIPIIAAAAMILTTMFTVEARRTRKAPRIERIGNAVQVRNAITGRLLWSRAFQVDAVFADPSPWRDGTVLVGLGFGANDGGRILLLDGKTGGTIWERSPDPNLAEAAFGEGVLEDLDHFAPISHRALDLDGDGVLEVAVSFMHMRNYPNCMMALNRSGEILGAYFSRGHVYAIEAIDLDGDGKQELICGGSNNRKSYDGGTVFILDEEHWSGAAVDPYNGGNLDVGDGSRRRILIPAFDEEMMGWLRVPRLAVCALLPERSSDGSVTITAMVGGWSQSLRLILDQDLNPISVYPGDDLVDEIARWPVEDPGTYGPNCPVWREEWMRGIIRVDTYALADETGPPAATCSEGAIADLPLGAEK